MQTNHLKIIAFFFVLLVTNTTAFGQDSKKRVPFTEIEYSAGRVVPNYVDNFPNTYIQHGLSLSLGSFKTDTTSNWAKYYNYPQTGFTLFYSNIGNNQIFGHQFSSLLFISFNLFNKSVKPYYFKLGIGASYFNTHFDSISNPRNLDVGSHLTWAFQAFLYKTLLEKDGFNLKGGIGFSHASNGHTQLPNLGINSGLLSVSAQFYDKNEKHYQLVKTKYNKKSSPKAYSIGLKQGLGFHEYGDKDGPVGGPKESVYTTSLYVGRTKNKHFKLNLGLTYRYYEIYYQQIVERNLIEYTENPRKSASNIVIYLNAEWLMGHFSIDVELGANVYKPFYKQFEKDFPPSARFNSYGIFKANFKRALATQLGLNLYLLNTNSLPKHNLSLGVHIKANAGQADFTEASIGYHYRLK